MAVTNFLPDRLNYPPVVYRGFTAGEFLLAAGTGSLVGIPLAVPLCLVPHVGWLAFPACMLLMTIVTVFFGGNWITAYKRGKPENYIWQRLDQIRCRLGLSRSMILTSRAWELQRTSIAAILGERTSILCVRVKMPPRPAHSWVTSTSFTGRPSPC